MKIAIAILLVLLIILLSLLYINNKSSNENIERMRIEYADSTRKHKEVQETARREILQARADKREQVKKDSIAKELFKKENRRLVAELKNARTPRVDSLIDAEPQLRFFIAYYDSVNTNLLKRIDTQEIEKRVQAEADSVILAKQIQYTKSVEDERNYLAGEVDKRDKVIDKQKRQLLKWKFFAGLGWLLNLVPRGG
jgi:hypothetical protein